MFIPFLHKKKEITNKGAQYDEIDYRYKNKQNNNQHLDIMIAEHLIDPLKFLIAVQNL
jgi:hypothetical protein